MPTLLGSDALDLSHNTPKSINVNSRTVFMTVGPSMAGKTTFCLDFLKPKLPGIVKYLSSDEIRWELLGDSGIDKYAPEMVAISELAFEQLFSRASSYMTWPCCVDFIIVDSTGLSESFRNKLLALCQEKNYNLLPLIFDYKTYEDYYMYASDKIVTTGQIETLRKKVIPKITSEFNGSRYVSIKNRDFSQYQVKVTDWNRYQMCFLPKDSPVIIIGNVNGCYDELLLLLKQFKITVDSDGYFNSPCQVVLIGDPYRDNASTTDLLLTLIRNNNIICVYEFGLPFVTARHRWIATASYQNKNCLGSRDRSTAPDIIDAISNEPYRIFGSHPSIKFERKDNLYLIDGGCVHGGELIGLRFGKDGKPFIRKQEALSTYVPGKRGLLFPKEIEIITSDALTPFLKQRHNKIVTAAAPFLSGTMSPSAADKLGEKIPSSFESLSQALLYYKRGGISEVCLQPKYMGSRCTVVLSNNSPCYAISRNGFTIRTPGISDLLRQLKTKFLNAEITGAIIDGELLPWSAMGRSLIDDTFRSVEIGLRKDVELLKKFGFDKQLDLLGQARDGVTVPLQKNNANKIGHGLYHSMVSYDSFIPNWISVDALERGLNIYSEQLALFSSDTPLEFKPFALLKTIDNTGKEIIYDEPAGINFKRISSDPHVVISTDDIMSAMLFYDKITRNQQMEGIVVKPESPNNGIVVPYLKVRNHNYLTLVYGPTYQEPKRLDALIKRKNVTDKQRLSLLEYEISKAILNIPMSLLGPSNEHYCNLVATFLQAKEDETKVDPRL